MFVHRNAVFERLRSRKSDRHREECIGPEPGFRGRPVEVDEGASSACWSGSSLPASADAISPLIPGRPSGIPARRSGEGRRRAARPLPPCPWIGPLGRRRSPRRRPRGCRRLPRSGAPAVQDLARGKADNDRHAYPSCSGRRPGPGNVRPGRPRSRAALLSGPRRHATCRPAPRHRDIRAATCPRPARAGSPACPHGPLFQQHPPRACLRFPPETGSSTARAASANGLAEPGRWCALLTRCVRENPRSNAGSPKWMTS